MSGETCSRMRLLIQAEQDGELSPAEAADLAAHRDLCADCAGLSERLSALSAALRQEAPYYPLPPALRDTVRRQAQALAPRPKRARVSWRLPAVSFGAGVALAAALAFAWLPRSPGLEAEVVSEHVRALQPGHLLDLPSSDQHQVKPWFDGRLDFAPPVVDLAAAGFPLTGGRLDVIAGRPVAALVYGRRQHVIDLFVAPASGEAAPVAGGVHGYNTVHWTEGGMTFWAVSDLNPGELRDFVQLLRQADR